MATFRQAFAVLPAKDLERAKAWYADKLGLVPAMEMEAGVTYMISGTGVQLYQSEFAGTARSTQLGLVVEDLEATMAELRSRGVGFEDYDMTNVKTTDGIAADDSGGKASWFTDSEGNIVNLVELPPGFELP